MKEKIKYWRQDILFIFLGLAQTFLLVLTLHFFIKEAQTEEKGYETLGQLKFCRTEFKDEKNDFSQYNISQLKNGIKGKAIALGNIGLQLLILFSVSPTLIVFHQIVLIHLSGLARRKNFCLATIAILFSFITLGSIWSKIQTEKCMGIEIFFMLIEILLVCLILFFNYLQDSKPLKV